VKVRGDDLIDGGWRHSESTSGVRGGFPKRGRSRGASVRRGGEPKEDETDLELRRRGRRPSENSRARDHAIPLLQDGSRDRGI
jgi:hypothetical protein